MGEHWTLHQHILAKGLPSGFATTAKAEADDARIRELRAEIERLRAALAWYAEMVKGSRDSEGARGHLHEDGGERARNALRGYG